MIVELQDEEKILPLLYRDPVCFVEEISLIDEDYLWERPTIYVDDPRNIKEFLILHSPSFYWGGNSVSAYMRAREQATIRSFADILRPRRDTHMHLQTSPEIEPQVRRSMPWLTGAYDVRYYCADKEGFRPHCLHRERAVLLTPENIIGFQPSADPRFVKRLKTAQVYGYLSEEGRLVATSGVGFLTKRSFEISYTSTEPEYRGRGIAKCLTSLASEPLIKRGLTGVYSTDVTNESSMRVATGLGFQPYKDLRCFYT